jgi:hypothetical protein
LLIIIESSSKLHAAAGKLPHYGSAVFVLRKPFKYRAGLLAVIRNTEGRPDFQRMEPDI